MLPAFETMMSQPEDVIVWGFVATMALTTLMYGSQGLGLSRLSLPFLVGTWFSGIRARAVAYGFLFYLAGGWLFAFLYCWLFTVIGRSNWWIGATTGTLHAVFLLAAVLPVVPYLHPRLATPYTGPTATRQLEPPGFMALNYGRMTPVTTVAAHVVYGAVIGAGYSVPA